MLHTVNKSPFSKNSINTCLRLAQAGSDILFIEDGVYAGLNGSVVASDIQQAVKKHNLYILEPDMMARGLDRDCLIEGIQIVGYDGFVSLAVKNEKVQSWL